MGNVVLMVTLGSCPHVAKTAAGSEPHFLGKLIKRVIRIKLDPVCRANNPHENQDNAVSQWHTNLLLPQVPEVPSAAGEMEFTCLADVSATSSLATMVL